jgi:allophanate hydrolase subunit 2
MRNFGGNVEAVDVIGSALLREVGAPSYGRQDIGFSPGGPMDRFSVYTGNVMLGNDDFAPALEIVFAQALEFKRDCIFVLTGAKRRNASLSQSKGSQSSLALEHGVVTEAARGDRLIPGITEYGFRTYLCLRPHDADGPPDHLIGRTRPPFQEISSWHDPAGRVRVMRGPEYDYLDNPSAFPGQSWLTTAEMNDMGARLVPAGGTHLSAKGMGMVSAPVNDGTVQLTASGPIVLLRGRQTIGGYPRIFNVTGADVDLFGQYGPNQIIHFKEVSREEAVEAARRKYQDLERFRRLWSSSPE